MSRFVRARTAASDTPSSAAIWVNGRRPSAWRCSMIRLSRAETSSPARPVARRRGRAGRPGRSSALAPRLGATVSGRWPTAPAGAGAARAPRGDRDDRTRSSGEQQRIEVLDEARAEPSDEASGFGGRRRPWIGPHSMRMFMTGDRDRRLALAGRLAGVQVVALARRGRRAVLLMIERPAVNVALIRLTGSPSPPAGVVGGDRAGRPWRGR